MSNNNNKEDMVDRLAKIQFANPKCADCPATSPRWASFLRDKEEEETIPVEGLLSVMVCDDCAIRHHNELGGKRCMIKCLECLHEWTHDEADVVLKSGNELVNSLYEAQLTTRDFDKTGFKDSDSVEEDDRRCKFVKNKYKKCKYRCDEAELQNALDRLRSPTAKRSKTKRTWSSDLTAKARGGGFMSRLVQGDSSYQSTKKGRVSRAVGSIVGSSLSLPRVTRKKANTTDNTPVQPNRCLSETSSHHHPSTISELTFSEGRSELGSSENSLYSWWNTPA